MSVQPAQLHQLGMGALLLNGTVLKHQYTPIIKLYRLDFIIVLTYIFPIIC